MSDRQNKFNGTEQQQNFLPNNLFNLGIGFPGASRNSASIVLNTTTNDALLAQYHHQQQAALLHGFFIILFLI